MELILSNGRSYKITDIRNTINKEPVNNESVAETSYYKISMSPSGNITELISSIKKDFMNEKLMKSAKISCDLFKEPIEMSMGTLVSLAGSQNEGTGSRGFVMTITVRR